MNLPTMVAAGLVSAACAYFVHSLIVLSFLDLTRAQKAFKWVFYTSSGLAAVGVAFAILRGGEAFGLSTGGWAVAFVVAQNTLWGFVAAVVLGVRRERRSTRDDDDERE